MIIDPRKSFRWLKFADKENIQQSGIDVRLDRVLSVTAPAEIGISSRVVSHHSVPMAGDWYELPIGTYDFQCIEYVEIPRHCCALLIQRSSLNRLGAFITTGLYDNSFHNYIGGILHLAHPMRIQRGTRIAQIIFIKSESRRQYKGKYNGKLYPSIP